MSEKQPLDRREFFRAGLRGLFRTVAETVDATMGKPPLPEVRRLRPPGALPEGPFLSACTRCDDCVKVCPAQCITHVPAGHHDEGTPVIIPSSRACVLCTDLACTQVCEPGALTPLVNWESVQVGLAWVDPGHCVTFDGEECTVCADVCPTDPPAITMDGGHPRVLADVCTGCGLCEERCPTEPRSIQVVPPGFANPFAPAAAEGQSGPTSQA